MGKVVNLSFNVTVRKERGLDEATEVAKDVHRTAIECGFNMSGPSIDIQRVAPYIYSVKMPLGRTMESRGIPFADYMDSLPSVDAIRARV